MTVKSKPFFWVECDEPGCDARCPDRGDDHMAWVEQRQAEEYAAMSDWSHGGTVSWGCPEHPRCEDCGDSAGDLAGERDYLCPACWQRASAAEVSA